MTDRPTPKRQRLPWTNEQLDFIATMRERGRGGEFIARELKERFGVICDASTVIYQCMRMGADIPPRLRIKPVKQKRRMRNGHVVRPFSKSDDKVLLEMKAAGHRTTEICRTLKRPSSSIIGRLMTLARQEARKETSR